MSTGGPALPAGGALGLGGHSTSLEPERQSSPPGSSAGCARTAWVTESTAGLGGPIYVLEVRTKMRGGREGTGSRLCPGHSGFIPLRKCAVTCLQGGRAALGTSGLRLGWASPRGLGEGLLEPSAFSEGYCPREGSPPYPAHVAAASGARRPPPGVCLANRAEAAAPAVGPRPVYGARLGHERIGAKCGAQGPESQTDFVGWTQ